MAFAQLQSAFLFGVWRLSAQILLALTDSGNTSIQISLEPVRQDRGCEAAIHSARRYLEASTPDHVLVKLDFTNAFNSLRRHDMLLSVYSRIP